MGKIYVLHNRKGGTGKTTTANALADGIRLAGKSVLIIDMDSQQNTSWTMRAVTKDKLTILDALLGNCKPADAIQNTANGQVIPADMKLDNYALLLQKVTGGKVNPLNRVVTVLETLRPLYDYIFIDTKPASDEITTGALLAADGVIIPTLPETYDLQGALNVLNNVRSVQQHNSKLKFIGLLITKVGRLSAHKVIIDKYRGVAPKYGAVVFDTTIREQHKPFTESQATQESIFKNHSKSGAGADYMAFIEEFIKITK